MTKQTNQLQQELIKSGLIEPVSLGGVPGYKSTTGESKNVLSIGNKPIGVVCDNKVYGLEPNGTPSGLLGYLKPDSQ